MFWYIWWIGVVLSLFAGFGGIGKTSFWDWQNNQQPPRCEKPPRRKFGEVTEGWKPPKSR
jgi:hypothetical protein